MFRSCFILMFIIFNLVLLVDSSTSDCSLTDSRTVRELVRKRLGDTVIDSYIPLSCPFHPLRDMFYVLERKKRLANYGRFQCLLCGKQFIEEEFLDMHLQTRHSEGLLTHKAVCLSDFCDIVGCKKDNENQPELDCATKKHLQVRCETIAKSCLSSSFKGDELAFHINKLCEHLQCSEFNTGNLNGLPQSGGSNTKQTKFGLNNNNNSKKNTSKSFGLKSIIGYLVVIGAVFGGVYWCYKKIKLQRSRSTAWDNSNTLYQARRQLRDATGKSSDNNNNSNNSNKDAKRRSWLAESDTRLDDPIHQDNSYTTWSNSSSASGTGWLKMRGKQSSANELDI